MAKDILYLCETCRPENHDDSLPRPGAVLLAEMQEKFGENLDIRGVKCLLQCDNPCAVSMSNANKFSYLLAGIESQDMDSLHQLFLAYQKSADGYVPFKERPQMLRPKIIARLPACQ